MIGYSVLTFKFPENREKYLGFGEAAAGVGLMFGPVIGGVLYTWLDYFGAFMCFAVFLAFGGMLCWFYIPNSLNARLDIQTDYEKVLSEKRS